MWKSASKFIYLFILKKYLFQSLQTVEIYLKIPFIDGWVHVEKSNKHFYVYMFQWLLIILRRLLTVDKSVTFFSTVV